MRVIVDAFGGDNAPLEVLRGTAQAQEELGIDIILCGKMEEIKRVATKHEIDISKMSIIDSPDVFDDEKSPREILRKNGEYTSLAMGLKALAMGRGDAFVSAGSTGALVMGATYHVKRLDGVKRAALATIIPSDDGPFMLLDCGANVECTPEMLSIFAIMGSIFMNKVEKIDNPKVGLLNIGTEEIKGTQLQRETNQILRTYRNINYVGNVEARAVPYGRADVVVCDGFTGNIFLKTFEGVAGVILGNIKRIFMKDFKTKMAALAVKSGLSKFKKKMDYKEFGGAPLMGLKKPVIKAHGSADAKTFKNAIRQAVEYTEQNVIDTIKVNLPKDKTGENK